ncbi:MAG: hypothetical protein U0835_08075 [Isosphaeraceae bacterium]
MQRTGDLVREPGRRRFRRTILGAMVVVAVAAVSFRVMVLARNARDSLRIEQEMAALNAERALLATVVARAEAQLAWSKRMNARGELTDGQLSVEEISLQKSRLDFEQVERRLRLLQQQFGAPAP